MRGLSLNVESVKFRVAVGAKCHASCEEATGLGGVTKIIACGNIYCGRSASLTEKIFYEVGERQYYDMDLETHLFPVRSDALKDLTSAGVIARRFQVYRRADSTGCLEKGMRLGGGVREGLKI